VAVHVGSTALDTEFQASPLPSPPQGCLLTLPTCHHPKGLLQWSKVQDCSTFSRERASIPFPRALWDTFLWVSADRSFRLREMLSGNPICRQPSNTEQASCPVSRMLSHPLGAHWARLRDTRPRHAEISVLVPATPARVPSPRQMCEQDALPQRLTPRGAQTEIPGIKTSLTR